MLNIHIDLFQVTIYLTSRIRIFSCWHAISELFDPRKSAFGHSGHSGWGLTIAEQVRSLYIYVSRGYITVLY